jgi:hypothetical protein
MTSASLCARQLAAAYAQHKGLATSELSWPVIGGLGFVSASAALAVTMPFEWARGELVAVYRQGKNAIRSVCVGYTNAAPVAPASVNTL